MKLLVAPIAILLSGLLFVNNLQAQTVTNASVTGAPAANSGIGAGNAPGWSGCAFSPDLCSVAFPSYSGNSQVARIASPDGGTWLGIAALGECAQTTITGLTPGNSYLLRFCGANFGTAALFNGSPAAPVITVVGGGSITLSIPQVANTWNPYQLSFTATAATMTLQCSIPNGSNSYASLDGFNLNGSICNPIILPVNFLNFNGEFQDCKVSLSWDSPSTEIAKDYELQRSIDGELFETIEKIAATQGNHGAWTDPFPLEDAYYRIRMYNEIGRVAESPIIPIQGQCLNPSLLILGNPISGQDIAFLKFTSKTEDGLITLSNAMGQVIGKYKVACLKNNWNEFELPLVGLAKGVYLLTSQDGAQAKLVLQ